MKLIRVIELEGVSVDADHGASRVTHDDRPVYVREYNPDANGGDGNIVTTQDPDRAKRFVSLKSAVEYYMRPSRVKPLKNGRPNRPLMDLGVTVVDVP